MFWQRRITVSEVASRLDDHMDSCDRRYDEMREVITSHTADVNAKHAENLQRFSKLERTIYIAAGSALAAGWLLSHAKVVSALGAG